MEDVESEAESEEEEGWEWEGTGKAKVSEEKEMRWSERGFECSDVDPISISRCWSAGVQYERRERREGG